MEKIQLLVLEKETYKFCDQWLSDGDGFFVLKILFRKKTNKFIDSFYCGQLIVSNAFTSTLKMFTNWESIKKIKISMIL